MVINWRCNRNFLRNLFRNKPKKIYIFLRFKYGLILIFILNFSAQAIPQNFQEPISHDSADKNLPLQLVQAGIARTKLTIRYDGSYQNIDYPNGDVPSHIGVCTDVVIRAYRAVNVDLQQLVHEDMKANFSQYPSQHIWGMKSTDTNIDHRRVPNLQMFFSRVGEELSITPNQTDYLAGDLVTWLLPGNLPHIGIVSNQLDEKSKTPLIIHNIGSGPELSNMLFSYRITGHYRYFPH
ncbi:MAG: DUF1287 domain-containing protein [Cellvibrionaceae bacterium]